MYGLIFEIVEEFVIEKFGLEAWHTIKEKAGCEIKDHQFVSGTFYEDGELVNDHHNDWVETMKRLEPSLAQSKDNRSAASNGDGNGPENPNRSNERPHRSKKHPQGRF